MSYNSVLNLKALVLGGFYQEKDLVGAFSVIVKTDCETNGSSAALFLTPRVAHNAVLLTGAGKCSRGETITRQDSRHVLRTSVRARREVPQLLTRGRSAGRPGHGAI